MMRSACSWKGSTAARRSSWPTIRRTIRSSSKTYGFKKIKDLYSWGLHQDKVFTEKLVRVSEAARQRQGLVFRTINMKDFDNEVKRVHELYTRGWIQNWGEVPLTEEEFNYMAQGSEGHRQSGVRDLRGSEGEAGRVRTHPAGLQSSS